MISTVTNPNCYKFRGLSTDTKPINESEFNPDFMWIGNGSIFLEMDTSKVYAFDEEHNVWIELEKNTYI